MGSPHLGFGNLLDFGEDESRLVFEGSFHEFVIAFGILAGAMLELQVPKIIIDRVATFEKLIELGAMWREIGSVGLDVEDEEKDGHSEGETSAEDGPIGHAT
jgi:hypothetical protein